MAGREFTVEGEYSYNRRGPIRWILSHLLRYKGFIAVFAIGTILSNVMTSAIRTLTGRAFDVVLAPGDAANALLGVALLILGAVLFSGLFDMLGRIATEFLAKRLERDAREELYISLLGQSQTFHNHQRTGDLMARSTNDVRQLNTMISPASTLSLTRFSASLCRSCSSRSLTGDCCSRPASSPLRSSSRYGDTRIN
ncbi:MAG: ABC transporter transmembrane domain-containing protein [Chloroflexia bacterium]